MFDQSSGYLIQTEKQKSVSYYLLVNSWPGLLFNKKTNSQEAYVTQIMYIEYQSADKVNTENSMGRKKKKLPG